MPEIAHSAHDMISRMTPALRPETFVFATTRDTALLMDLSMEAIATFKEDEGVSLIVPLETAIRCRLETEAPMRCITLNVFSSLHGVGLTAAVSAVLADKGIACNMVAAYHHDHVFVPATLASQPMDALEALQRAASPDE